MTVQEYIQTNRQWLGERICANLEQIADSDWPALLEGTDIVNMGATDPGIDCDVVITHETLDDFDASRLGRWREAGIRTEVECGGRKAVLFDKFQRHKGAQRETILVIDFGDKRVALQ